MNDNSPHTFTPELGSSPAPSPAVEARHNLSRSGIALLVAAAIATGLDGNKPGASTEPFKFGNPNPVELSQGVIDHRTRTTPFQEAAPKIESSTSPKTETQPAETEPTTPKPAPTPVKPAATPEAPSTSESDPMPEIEIPVTNTPTPEQLTRVFPENLSIPEEVRKIMERDVVYIEGLGCSGMLVRDQITGEAIGVLTAEHCKKGDEIIEEVDVPQGISTISFNETFKVRTGNYKDDLKTVGEFNKIGVNHSPNAASDVAVAAFGDHTIEEVLANSNFDQSNVDMLEPGDTIYSSGWPVDQPDNKGVARRQEFAMTFLGQDSTVMTGGESGDVHLNVLVAAVSANADGSTCSPGGSGKIYFTARDGRPLLFGVHSTSIPFDSLENSGSTEEAEHARRYAESFGVPLGDKIALCTASIEPPSSDPNEYPEVLPPPPPSMPPVMQPAPETTPTPEATATPEPAATTKPQLGEPPVYEIPAPKA